LDAREIGRLDLDLITEGALPHKRFWWACHRWRNAGHIQVLSPNSVVKKRKAAVSSGMANRLLDVARG